MKDFNVEYVDVKPGVYRFRHNEHAREQEGGEECIYTNFEWVRDPDPLQDFLSSYEEVDVNPNAYVQAKVARWPTLYGKVARSRHGKDKTVPWQDMTAEEQRHAWQRVADQTFCTIGGGVKWHEKGFPKAKVDPEVLDVEPPAFREQCHWYPFSKPYGGLFEPKLLTPSFAKFAFRVLESIISFGMTVRNNAHSREVRCVRERMSVAVKRYRELAKKYPNQADPEYVSWLSQKGRAEAWVENFDLGPEFTAKHREHAASQRWVPEGTYAVAFKADKLESGHFAWNPKQGGCWANKSDAKRYAILAHEGSDCFWATNATNTSVPLYFVARVVKLGEVSHMGETLVEIAFDYGTKWMLNEKKRKALAEHGEKDAISLLTKEEYEALLPTAIEYYKEVESQV